TTPGAPNNCPSTNKLLSAGSSAGVISIDSCNPGSGSYSFSPSATSSAYVGATIGIFYVLDLESRADAHYPASPNVAIDHTYASGTIDFFVVVNTPAVSFYSDSGGLYNAAVSTPEPSNAGLLTGCILVLLGLARKHHVEF